MAVTGRYLFTQPESLLAVVAIVLIYFATYLDANSFGDVFIRFLHLTSFSVYVGMSFWVTFIAGLTKYNILPRNWFSLVQSTLFSKFVTYCMAVSSTSLVTYYLILKGQTEGATLHKISGLVICVASSFLGCLIIKPLVRAIAKRNEMEHAENVGYGVADNNEGVKKLREASVPYAKLYSRVVWLHGASALLNLVSLIGMALHMANLSYTVTFN